MLHPSPQPSASDSAGHSPTLCALQIHLLTCLPWMAILFCAGIFGALKPGFQSLATLKLVVNVVANFKAKRTAEASRGFLATSRLSCNCLLRLQVWQFHHWFDQRFTRRHGTYVVELRCLWSVPRHRRSRRYSQPAVCLRLVGVQISDRAVSEHPWCRKLLWAGGLHSP